MAKMSKPDYAVGEMDDLKPWVVTFTYHDRNENFYVETRVVENVDITDATSGVRDEIAELSEKEHWSDWIITNVNLIREVH